MAHSMSNEFIQITFITAALQKVASSDGQGMDSKGIIQVYVPQKSMVPQNIHRY